MKKIQFLNKKAIVTSLLVCTILVLVSTAVPAIQSSTVTGKEITLNTTKDADKRYTIQISKIFEFMEERLDNNEYKRVTRSLGFLQRHCLRDKSSNSPSFDLESFIMFIESQNEETQEKVKNMVEETYSAISTLDGKNTEDFYTYSAVYAIADILTLHFSPTEWIRISKFILFIGAIDAFIAIILAGMDIVPLPSAIIFGAFTGLLPMIYVEIVFRTGSWLTGKSIDLAFYVLDNSTGQPINGLTITAEPIDNNGIYKFPIQEAGQLPINENTSGWYYIPMTHNSQKDVPPGIHHVVIEGEGNESSYYYEFNTPGISMNGRYCQTITIDPEK